MTCWVWVLGHMDGLRWVLEHNRMAFQRRARARRLDRIDKSDRAILFVTRAAFSNPMRHESRLIGVVRVTDEPESRNVSIGGKVFGLIVPFRPEIILGERSGPPAAAIAKRLEFVKRPEVWGTYFRNSPIEVSQRDFDVMARAIEGWRKERRD